MAEAIANVLRVGSNIVVYDESMREISHMHLDDSVQFLGFTASSFSVKSGSNVRVYDANCKEISHKHVD